MSSLSFNKNQIIEFINQCNVESFDLSNYEFVDPVYWVVIKTLKKLKSTLKVHINPKSSAYSYVQYLFSREDKKAKTTVPVREIQYHREIEKFVNELLNAADITVEDWEDKNAFKYLLIELINNAIDHGRSPAIACAQKFPAFQEMEIVVSDCGLGFLETIKRKYPDIQTYHSAIKKALEKGVTGSQIPLYGSSIKNIGMGLYVISKIINRIEGNMFIVSGNSFYSLKNDESVNLNINWQGSIVALRFNLNKFQEDILDYGFNAYIEGLFHEEGEDIFLEGEDIF